MAGTISTFMLVGLAIFADASSFLEAQPQGEHRFAKEHVEQQLFSVLSFGGLGGAAQLRSVEEDLRTMYAAVPKGAHGKLEPHLVRYILHRYFVQKHGWYIEGLDPKAEGSSQHTWSPTSFTKEQAPRYIQTLLGQHMLSQGQGGLGLNELAVFATTLLDLVHHETNAKLLQVYAALRISTTKSRGQILRALKMYALSFLLDLPPSTGFAELEKEALRMYPGWQGVSRWLEDLGRTMEMIQQSRRNPFVEQHYTFADAAAWVQEFQNRFGSFQNLECLDLKRVLVKMEHRGSGRVPLSSFYRTGMGQVSPFQESEDVLRDTGILDETDADRPSVVIPNYLTGVSNCVTSAGFYSVCCMDQCEGIRRRLEVEIAAPAADPARIADVVAKIPSETVKAPRNLTSKQLARLNEIADVNTGSVPLHGRLFAQWLHHVYPRECSFPQVAGAVKAHSFKDMAWEEKIASSEEMLAHASVQELPSAGGKLHRKDLPWSSVEEDLVGFAEKVETSSRGWASYLRCAAFIAALSSFALTVGRILMPASASLSDKKAATAMAALSDVKRAAVSASQPQKRKTFVV